ncbi:hypothetical protein H0H81_009725 [Sphagnurus paluster]|uniref:SRR1-like domain-containing protein n=1 Tax=Sphagnurus paluster TaxID=117069 RepID=A0A9P7FRG0_9AGAR|nr:hypothetical protein H0H81_009725 [Sphagnurus paluster]
MSSSTSQSPVHPDFIPVNRRKRKSRATNPREPPLAAVQRVRDELARDDGWLAQCQQILIDAPLARAPLDVLCLGLGSPTASPNARAQLAFLLAACERLSIDRAKVSLYDPVFTPEDRMLFSELGLQLLAENKARMRNAPGASLPPAPGISCY